MRIGVVLLVVAWGLALPANAQSEPAALLIEGDEELDAEHGVTAGSGTADDPFVIDDLLGKPRLELHGTTAHVLIRGLRLGTGSFQWFGAGIELHSTANVTVDDVEVTSFQYGVHAIDGKDLVVRGSAFEDQVFHGVFLERGSRITVERSSMAGTQAAGLAAQDVRTLTVANNTLEETGRTSGRVSSAILVAGVHDAVVVSNTVRGGKAAGVLFESVQRYDLSHNVIESPGGHGLWIDSSSAGTVLGNRVTASPETGIYFCTEGAAVADGNTVLDSDVGIDLAHVSGIVVTNNTVEESGRRGLQLREADDNRAESNRFLRHINARPVVEVEGDRNVFANNTMEGNDGPAYWLVAGEGNLFDGTTLVAQGKFPEPEEPGKDGPAPTMGLLLLALVALALTARRGV